MTAATLPVITGRQLAVMTAIREAVASRGYPPSLREIGDKVGLSSPSSVSHQLVCLEQKGFIRRRPNQPRAIELVVTGTSPGSVIEQAIAALESGADADSRNADALAILRGAS